MTTCVSSVQCRHRACEYWHQTGSQRVAGPGWHDWGNLPLLPCHAVHGRCQRPFSAGLGPPPDAVGVRSVAQQWPLNPHFQQCGEVHFHLSALYSAVTQSHSEDNGKLSCRCSPQGAAANTSSETSPALQAVWSGRAAAGSTPAHWPPPWPPPATPPLLAAPAARGARPASGDPGATSPRRASERCCGAISRGCPTWQRPLCSEGEGQGFRV